MSTNDRSLGELVQNVIAILMILAGLGGITSSIIGGLITILGGVLLSSFMMDKILEFNDAIPKKLLFVISVILIVLGRMIIAIGGIEKEEQFVKNKPQIAEQYEGKKERGKIAELEKSVKDEVSIICNDIVKKRMTNPRFIFSIAESGQVKDGNYYVEVEYKLSRTVNHTLGTTCFFDKNLNFIKYEDYDYWTQP